MTEKRHYPRIKLAAPTLIELKDGELLSVELDNISSSGLQLSCGREAEALITPNGQWTPDQLKVTIELPDLEGEFESKCAVITSRRVAANRFCIGLRFTEFMGDSFDALGKYIESQAGK